MLNKIKKCLFPKVGVRERGLFRPMLVVFSPEQVVTIPSDHLKTEAVTLERHESEELEDASSLTVTIRVGGRIIFTANHLTQEEADKLVKSFRNRASGKWGIGRWVLAIIVASFIISGSQPDGLPEAPAAHAMQNNYVLPPPPLAPVAEPDYPEATPVDGEPAGAPLSNAAFGLPESAFSQ
jgi:hypothetical protein